MALLDSGLKQRIVGALVLLALMVIFLPMLLSRQDDLQRVVVDAPLVVQLVQVLHPRVRLRRHPRLHLAT